MSPVTSTLPRRRGRPSGGSTAVDNDALLELALELFAEVGFEGASIRELCRRLGVSHNLVHQRFGSKERLWYASVDHGFRHLAGEFAEAVIGAEDEIDGLRRVMSRFLEVTARSPALVGIINQESISGGPRLDHLVDRYLAPAVRFMDAAIETLVDEGRMRPLPASVLYVLVAHGAGGVLSMGGLAGRLGLGELTSDETALAAYVSSVVDIIISGLTVPTREVTGA